YATKLATRFGVKRPMVAPERKTTPRQQSGRLCRSVAFTVALCVAPYPAAIAKEAGSAQDVAQYLKDRDPKTALITLKNAIRKSPRTPRSASRSHSSISSSGMSRRQSARLVRHA